MNYTALDFETANSSRASVCAVGFVRVEDGKIVKSAHQLINPQMRFDYRNEAVHGITEYDVRNAPIFSDYWDELRPYLGDVVIAHNAAFDISCLRATLDVYGLAAANFKYLCTLRISRKTLGMQSNSLDSLARALNLGCFKHHNALEDAAMCAKLFEVLRARTDVSKFAKDFLSPQDKIRSASDNAFDNKRANSRPDKLLQGARRSEPHPSAEDKTPSSQFPPIAKNEKFFQPELFKFAKIIGVPQEGCKPRKTEKEPANLEELLDFDFSPIDFSKKFVVTGIFSSISRKEAESLILYRGGEVQKAVNSQTDYIVVGGVKPPSWNRGEYGEKIDAALKIGRARFLSESHFLREIQ